MELEMEEFVIESFDTEEIDFNYEFDAPRFYDFTRPETDSEATNAELWFEFMDSYPPSPFAVKLKGRMDIYVESENTSYKSRDGEETSIGSEVSALNDNDRGEFYNCMAQDSPKAKTKSSAKSSLSRSSTLMKPTASHLAKQNPRREVHSNRFSKRFQKLLVRNDDKTFQKSSMMDSQATKRQKLEAGYLRKVAHLKHQALFLHKVPKKVGLFDVNSTHFRSNVTIPRGPNLETAHRAQRHRSKVHAELAEQAKSNARTFKAHPMNRKIFEASSLPLSKKSTPQLPQFQVFHLRTSERAMQHTSNNVANTCNHNSISQNETADSRRVDSVDALKEEKCKAIRELKARLSKKIFLSKGEIGVSQNIKQESTITVEFPTDKRFTSKPPIELFSKLSLASEAQSNIKSQAKMPLPTKGSKENTPGCFNLEHEINVLKETSQRFGGKQYHCGSDRRIPDIGSQLNINRSLDIR